MSMRDLINNTKLYDYLLDGKLAEASFYLYDDIFQGMFIGVLFLTVQTLLYLKTKSALLCWAAGVFIFAATYFTNLFDGVIVGIIGILLLLELTGILYYTFFKS